MATTEITQESFATTVKKDGIVLVDWWASWCGPCRAFAPVFEAASAKHPGVTFAKVNTEQQQELAQAFGISAIPTLMLFRDGVLLFSQAGALPGQALEQLIAKAGELDMVEVRKEIAEREAQEDAVGNRRSEGGEEEGGESP